MQGETPKYLEYSRCKIASEVFSVSYFSSYGILISSNKNEDG